MAASSRIDRGYRNLSKTIAFWPFFRVTILRNDPGIIRRIRRAISFYFLSLRLYPAILIIQSGEILLCLMLYRFMYAYD